MILQYAVIGCEIFETFTSNNPGAATHTLSSPGVNAERIFCLLIIKLLVGSRREKTL